jgi:hypothetical protein
MSRPVERTLWRTDFPRCSADLFPQQADKLVMLSLPKYLSSSVAKIKKGMEFYIVEFQRKYYEGEKEWWEVILMGNLPRQSAKAVASNVDPLNASHYPAWGIYEKVWTQVVSKPKRSKMIELKYSNADLSAKGYYKHKLLITEEVILPITPFQLTVGGQIPSKINDRIKMILEHRMKAKSVKKGTIVDELILMDYE